MKIKLRRGLMVNIEMKRIYEKTAPTDGFRVLVDRLWPRGVKKESANIDLWAKDITPTTELREEYHHGHLSWQEFSALYRTELLNNPALDSFLHSIEDKNTVTLLFAGKDIEHSHVNVIIEVLKEKLKG
jgi:uncharacterized protein YeaO (DUF488 family)